MITFTPFFKKYRPAVVLVLTLVWLAPRADAQQLDDVLVSAFAEAQSPGNGSICWTLGELMVELYANGDALDQGFLQIDCLLTDATEPAGELGTMPAIRIYPNPVETGLTIQTEVFGRYRAEVFDVHGRSRVVQAFAGDKTRLDVSNLPGGIYLLRVILDDKNATTFIIQKIK